MLHRKSWASAFILAASGLSSTLSAQVVRMDTTLGGIDLVLTPNITPLTVANFMTYANNGHYNKTIIHRSLNSVNTVSGVFYLIQGGGYILGPANLPTSCNQSLAPSFTCNAPVVSEFKSSNIRGSIAMALYGNDVNSATDQWYINTSDNSAALDAQSFTVFGNVANPASLAVVDLINNLPTYTYNAGTEASFGNLPLQNYSSGLIKPANYIFVNSITQLNPTATAAGMVSAASYSSSSTNGISPGEILTLFGSNLGPKQVSTLTVNTSNQVDSTLQGTQITFNGTPAPMIFTYDGQIAFVVPYGIANSKTVTVVASYMGLQTASMQFNVVPANPAILTLHQSGQGDAAIIRYNDGSVISSTNPASAGDTLELYAEGYGAVTGGLTDGSVVSTPFSIPTTLLIDGKPVNTIYSGPAGGDVLGVLQINFVVPTLTPGTHAIQFQVGNAVSPAGVTLQTK